jgi:hypothetical protein
MTYGTQIYENANKILVRKKISERKRVCFVELRTNGTIILKWLVCKSVDWIRLAQDGVQQRTLVNSAGIR